MKIEAGLRGVRTEAKEQFQTLYTGQQDIVHLVKDIAEAAATQEQVDKHEERIERIVSKYTVELQEDRKHLRQVSNPHLTETPFRLPQLMLIDVGPHEWLRIGELLPMSLHAESTVSSPGHSVLYYCYGSDMFFLWSAQSG